MSQKTMMNKEGVINDDQYKGLYGGLLSILDRFRSPNSLRRVYRQREAERVGKLIEKEVTNAMNSVRIHLVCYIKEVMGGEIK